ncbi:MAG TPA: GNAT family N-acetyltransferase [Nitrososphaerales archaeon]|nr:GNAT family N-acetyltransferase [Nitrososphaerales archaeon]
MAVTVRRAQIQDTEAISRIHVDTWRTTYRNIIPSKILDGMSYGRSKEMWDNRLIDDADPTAVFVAEAETGAIVGFVSCGPARGPKHGHDGEIYAIYVTPRTQRMGVGRMLVLAAVRDLRARGLESMVGWVLGENPFKKFYESLGGEPALKKEIAMGGKTMEETGYVWKSLSTLAAKLEDHLRSSP